MSLKNRLQEDVKAALRGGRKPLLAVLRLIHAAIKQREVDERIDLDDTQVIAVLDKMLKQRKESLGLFEKAGRDDLAQQESFEIGVIRDYLPEPASEAEIAALVDTALAETGAASLKDMGKVMGFLKPKLQGRADMGAVSAAIKAKLGP